MSILSRRSLAPYLAIIPLAIAAMKPQSAEAATRSEIDREVASAVATLHGMDNARPLFAQAQAVLVFPKILSGGFIIGGQYGEGALLRGSNTEGYYNIAGASFGLQIGAQVAGLAMFFMTNDALAALMRADGWEIGSGPSVVVLDRGVQANVSATTLREPVYAISFSQEGLMAALALNGTKITKITPAA
ncbi:Las17-binding protein actin regulator [Humitalea rosea]|uniref:Las17-binding protein actin regulator n=1 Tax=Humitalea rosea TaxID=990373 RepID=A0A2W7IKB1_9PROT|nr:lipid-binding SYLF domain-containing protein [Humitalea rosea]PZW45667.1 Las17-binding protein actin regulator [Humitalea rosea]